MRIGGYHIIIVPSDSSKTKRLHLSRVSTRVIALLSALILPLIGTSVFTTLHYQDKAVSLKRSLNDEKLVLEQKDLLMTQLAGLERGMAQATQTLNQIENSLEADTSQIKSGLGPIEKDAVLRSGKNKKLLKTSIEGLIENTETFSLNDYKTKIKQINSKISDINQRIDQVVAINQDKIRFLNASPDFMPVAGWVTSGFGYRRHPYSGRYKMHMGMDIAAPSGTPVRAPADGIVTLAEYKGGYGRKIIIDHGFGIVSLYAHASKILVKEGQKIKRGDQIALVGSTGASTGPHLHYEIHVDGIPTDPLMFVMK